MKLTPLDIHQKEFRHVLRGYNEEEVDSFLDEVANEFERLFQENIDLKEQVERLQKKLAQYENFEQTLQDTMIAAQKSAEDIQNNAKRAGELIIRDAELKSKEMMQEAFSQHQTFETNFTNLKKMADDFRDRFKTILEEYLKKLEEIDKAEARLPEELLAASAAAEPFGEAEEVSSLPEMPATEEQDETETAAAEETLLVAEEQLAPAFEEETPVVAKEVPEREDPVAVGLEGDDQPLQEEPAQTGEAVSEVSEEQVDALKEAMRKLREEAEAFGIQAEPAAEEALRSPQEEEPEQPPVEVTDQESSSEETDTEIEEIS